MNIISSVDNDFTSSSISQKKSDYLNTITGTIKFVAYEGDDYYNNLEECELYGLTFKNVMNNWSSKQEKYNFDTFDSENQEISADWTAKKYSVIFHNGDAQESRTVTYNTVIASNTFTFFRMFHFIIFKEFCRW